MKSLLTLGTRLCNDLCCAGSKPRDSKQQGICQADSQALLTETDGKGYVEDKLEQNTNRKGRNTMGSGGWAKEKNTGITGETLFNKVTGQSLEDGGAKWILLCEMRPIIGRRSLGRLYDGCQQ